MLCTQMIPRSSNGVTWVHDRRTGTEERVNVKEDGTPSPRYALPAALSADGTKVALKSYDDLAPGGTPDSSPLYGDLGERGRSAHRLQQRLVPARRR
ncbi:hypothetical protein GCM10009535_45120 [Streptomyces thermocarboxydovorans]|uniref:Uncharacterized protein n=1 Tax=Streptomyces thermocarboxydovorans TaxID=59298 RepID=A0ABN1HNI4_9ACTN